MRILALAALLVGGTCFAHVMSMSNGELRIDGAVASYDLRIPQYEVANLEHEKLLDSIRFGAAKRIAKDCVVTGETLHCTAKYLFNENVNELDVECKFASVTVPNHVHIFRAIKATGESEQAFFDSAFTGTRMKFRPPTAGEFYLKALADGFRRGLTGLTTALFLFAIAMTARSRNQFLLLCAILMAVEIAFVSIPSIRLSPKFLEAAAALSTAYVAIERLLVPEAGQRWLVVGVLGVFHGLFFRFYAAELERSIPTAAGFDSGLIAANLIWMIPAGLLRFLPARAQQIFTGLLFLTGTFWFVYRILN